MIKKGMFIGNRYEVLDKVGSGGMSDVYKAKDHKLNRFVAIKVLKHEFSKDKNFVSKFRVEAQSAARLEHTNIVNVYDVGEDAGLYYIVMELVEGITLKQYIARKKRLSVKEATSIAIQIAQGIECAHNNQIVHRDIKPQNIIISREGKVKVTDFGIAKAASANTINGNAMGSVHYISPEQAKGSYVDERSDIYSLGITMYEMLTGKVPFDGDNTVNIALQHIQNNVPDIRSIIPEMPVSISKIVLKCTQNKPDRRYPKISSLIADLKKSLLNPYDDFVRFDSNEDLSETTLITDSGIKKINPDDGKVVDEKIEKIQDNNDIDAVDPKLDKLITVGGIIAGIIMFIIIVIIITVVVQSNNVEIPTTPQKESSTIDSKQTIVPAVVGMTEDEAQEALHDKALGYHYEGYVYNDEYESGYICKQSVDADSVIDKHTTVILTVSKGSEKLEIPKELVGEKLADVESKLDEIGVNWEIEYEYNSASVDTVLDINPSEGAPVSKGDTVHIKASRGTKISTTTIVPSLIGKKEKDAKSSISAAGLKVGEIRYVNDESVANGKVIRQTVKSGGTIPKGTTIGLVVSLGPVEVTTVPETTTQQVINESKQAVLVKSQLYFEDDNTPVTGGVITVTYSNGQTEATDDASTWDTTIINVPTNQDGTDCTYTLMIGSRIVKINAGG